MKQSKTIYLSLDDIYEQERLARRAKIKFYLEQAFGGFVFAALMLAILGGFSMYEISYGQVGF